MSNIDNQEGAWILAFIAMVGAVWAGLFKLISKNGCRLKCQHCNGASCCDLDCEEGNTELEAKKMKLSQNSDGKLDTSEHL